MLEQLHRAEHLATRLDLVHALAKLLGHDVAARISSEAVAPERAALRALGDLEHLAQSATAPLRVDGAWIDVAPGERWASLLLGVLGGLVVVAVRVGRV